jgi:hypothetical protein
MNSTIFITLPLPAIGALDSSVRSTSSSYYFHSHPFGL